MPNQTTVLAIAIHPPHTSGGALHRDVVWMFGESRSDLREVALNQDLGSLCSGLARS